MNTPKCAECECFASKKEHDEGYWNLCEVCFHRDDQDGTDKIEGLTKEKLIKIAYESRCFLCLCEVYDGRKGGNYWGCNGGCGRKCCDECFQPATEEEDDEGYICPCCRKNGTK